MLDPNQGRPEAAAVIWDPSADPAADAAGSEAPGHGRVMGILQGLVAVGVGLALYRFWSTTVGTVVVSIGSIVALSALISPAGLYLGIRRFFAALGRWTGTALTWILMPALFYLFFLPFGTLLRRGRRDRLRRFYEPETETYWEPHEGLHASSGSYERQY